MKHLTDEIRDVSTKLIEHHKEIQSKTPRIRKVDKQKIRTLDTPDMIEVQNHPSYKMLLMPLKNVQLTTFRGNLMLEKHDHYRTDAFEQLEHKRSIIRDGRKMLLGILPDDIQIKQLSVDGTPLLPERNIESEEQLLDDIEMQFAHSLIIKDNHGFVEVRKFDPKSKITKTYIEYATKEDLQTVLNFLTELK